MLFLPLYLTLIIAVVKCDMDLKEGDSCTSESFSGKCRLLTSCIVVYEELVAGGTLETLCGYNSESEAIVCCPNDSSPKRKHPTTTSTTRRPTRPIRTTTEFSFMPRMLSDEDDDDRNTLHPLMVSKDRTPGSRAAEKCYEYSQSLYQLVYPPVLKPNVQPVNTSLCALGSSPTLIVGGTRAQPKKFPHMAAIGYNGGRQGIKWHCGGTLISDRFVLTAAHCLFSLSYGPATYVRLGEQNLESDNDGARPQNFRILDKIKHPKYNSSQGYNDIALLELDKQVRFNAWIRPACLPIENTTYDLAVATGWGRVEWSEEVGSDELLAVTLKMVSNSRCNYFYRDDDTLSKGISAESQLCAGEEGKDTCQGDSGGPLAIFNTRHKCMYDVIGVTSLGRICGLVTPGVYTNVLHYLSWIEDVVWP